MKILSAKFETSCSTFAQTLALTQLSQFAFVGRSNVGKSSLLNMLTNQKKLAITSSTPGRTRLINFFRITINDSLKTEIFLTDLPGYGYATASKSAKDGWSTHITDYLTKSQQLRRVFALLDIRHKPTEQDIQMLQFLQSNQIPFSIIATKADKLSRAQISVQLRNLVSHIGIGIANVIVTSSKNNLGKQDVLDIISSTVYSEIEGV